MKSICIIPARGGSKGVLNKNIIDIYGKPLIYFSIRSAIESNLFDKVIVTTDSEDIANVCISYGAEVPFIRPSYLAKDNSLIKDVITHCLKYVEKEYKTYPYVCLKQPTTPLVSKEDIIKSFELLIDKKADMVISVSETLYNVNWIGFVEEDLSMKNFKLFSNSKICGTQRQDFKKTYILNGGIYFAKWDMFYNKKEYYKQNTYAYIMPKERSIDIDTEFDIYLLKFILNRKNFCISHGGI